MADIHNLFPPAPPSGEYGATSDTNAPCDGRGVVTPLRFCPPIDLERAARATRDGGMQQHFREHVDLHAALLDRRSTLDKITDAIGSPLFLSFYCGGYVGCLLTVALAFAWSFAQ